MNETNRPTKKQRELLSFIDGFIKGNGYGPSYREVMRALEYKSVSTVATHIDGLIARGYLRKKDNSARTLEVVTSHETPTSGESAQLRTLFEQKLRDLRQVDDETSQQRQTVLKEAMILLGLTTESNVD